MSFSTLGDGVSTPRLQGLPDVFDGIENATQDWQKLPGVYAALQSQYVLLLLLAIDDAAQVMNAVANGKDTDPNDHAVMTISRHRTFDEGSASQCLRRAVPRGTAKRVGERSSEPLALGQACT